MASNHIGKDIWVLTDEGRYYGTIHSVDGRNKKLILQKVSMADGKKLRGLQIFFTNEIHDLQLLDDTKDDNDSNSGSTGQAPEEAEQKEPEEDLTAQERKLDKKDPSDEGSRLIPRKPLVPSQYLAGDENYITVSSDDEFNDIPDIIVVDEYGEKFDSALACINEQRVVGLAAEGNQIGRSGSICLLVVGCRGTIYIFDVHKLGADCFSNGLQSFLENSYVLKVIHDCRFLSDCLFNVYKTEMKNIFDTQVADIIIYKQKRGKLPREVNGLEPCLYEYLNLKPAKCTFSSVINKFSKNDSNLWTTRPIAQELLDAVAQKVLFLRELRITQMENMLAEFLYGVDIYLEVFRDSPTNYSNTMWKTRKVPESFHSLKKITERRWKKYEDRDNQANRGFTFHKKQNGQVITYRDDGGWTEGKEFAEMYRKKHGKIIERDDIHKGTMPSSLVDGAKVDAVNAPWKLIRLNSDSSEQSKEDCGKVTYRSEGFKQEKSKKKEVTMKQRSEKFTENWEDSKKDKNENSLLEVSSTITSTDKGYSQTSDYSPASVGDTYNADVSSFSKTSFKDVTMEPRNLQKETLLGAMQKKKIPIDWFDCDTPSTDRSRSSSIDSDPNSRYVTNQMNSSPNLKDVDLPTRYDKEYPPLDSPESPNRSESSPGRNTSSDPLGRDLSVGSAKRDLSACLGVKDSGRLPSLGRAKKREYFAKAMRASQVPGVQNAMQKTNLKDVHDFPSDNVLLHADPIIRTDSSRPILGQKTTVHKITTKE